MATVNLAAARNNIRKATPIGTPKKRAPIAPIAKPIGIISHVGRGLFGVAAPAPIINKGTATPAPAKPIFSTKVGGTKTAPVSTVNF